MLLGDGSSEGVAAGLGAKSRGTWMLMVESAGFGCVGLGSRRLTDLAGAVGFAKDFILRNVGAGRLAFAITRFCALAFLGL